MKSTVNVEIFMLAQLEHFYACIIQKSHMYVTGCVKSVFFLMQAHSYTLPKSTTVEWSVSAGGLIQQTSKGMAVWLLV